MIEFLVLGWTYSINLEIFTSDLLIIIIEKMTPTLNFLTVHHTLRNISWLTGTYTIQTHSIAN